jgi:hypothetical protein
MSSRTAPSAAIEASSGVSASRHASTIPIVYEREPTTQEMPSASR